MKSLNHPKPSAPRPPAYARTAVRSTAIALACSATLAASASPADDQGLGEIIVTAQKYESTVQSTPFSISAVSGEQLLAAGINSVEDLAHTIPGLSMRSAGPGQTEYEARGLASNGGAAPTVGFYLDEIPLSPPAQAQVGKVVIDPDLYDVNRIELLRGPQGTLYGSGSMGGTVKVVTNQPKLDTFEGSFQGTLSDTQGGGVNGGGSFMLNLPFDDRWALRLVGTDTYRSGWINRIVVSPLALDTSTRANVLTAPVQLVDKDANTANIYGGRASLLFKATDDLSIVGTVLYQRMRMGGYDEFDAPPGPAYMAHYENYNIPEPITDDVHIYSLVIKDNLGFAELTSATSFFDRDETQYQDASESFTWALNTFIPAGTLTSNVPTPYAEEDKSRQFSQELRLTSPGGEQSRVHWVGGAFFSTLHSDWLEYGQNPIYSQITPVVWGLPPSDNPNGYIYNGDNLYAVKQYALFADGSYKLNDQWTASAGVRWFRYSSSLSVVYAEGLYAPTLQRIAPVVTTASDSGFNPRFNLSYAPNPDLTTYASIAKGFRPGGAVQQVNVQACGAPVPTAFGPDSVWNYEVGEKAKLFGDWLTINSDVFYIKWSDIQQAVLLSCGYQYTTTAGNGRSYGPELEVNAKLSNSWTLSANGGYTDAKIDNPSAAYVKTLLAIGGYGGCTSSSNCAGPILNVPKTTGSVALVYSTPISDQYKLSARASAVYVGSSTDIAYQFLTLPSYSLTNFRATLANSSGKWSADLYVNNLTNKVAWLTANNTSFQVNIPALTRISTNQPRTFGTQIDYHF